MTGIACEETPLLGRVAKLERTYIADFLNSSIVFRN